MELLSKIFPKKSTTGGVERPGPQQPKPDQGSWLKYAPTPKFDPTVTEVSSVDIPRNMFGKLGLPEDDTTWGYEARNRLKTFSDGSLAVECIGIDASPRRSSHVEWSERRYLSPEEYARTLTLISQQNKSG